MSLRGGGTCSCSHREGEHTGLSLVCGQFSCDCDGFDPTPEEAE